MNQNTNTNVIKMILKKMAIYQTNDYTLHQIKGNKFTDKFKPNLNKT